MRGADDPGVRSEAIARLTEELIGLAEQLRALGVPPEDIKAMVRRMLGEENEG